MFRKLFFREPSFASRQATDIAHEFIERYGGNKVSEIEGQDFLLYQVSSCLGSGHLCIASPRGTIDSVSYVGNNPYGSKPTHLGLWRWEVPGLLPIVEYVRTDISDKIFLGFEPNPQGTFHRIAVPGRRYETTADLLIRKFSSKSLRQLDCRGEGRSSRPHL